MTDAVLSVTVVGVIVLALTVDVSAIGGALVGWLQRRWR
jgi:hypothetical protein